MKKILKSKCIVCQREFNYNSVVGKRSRSVTLRSPNSRTCSKQCSKVYIRIVQALRQRLVRQIKGENKK